MSCAHARPVHPVQIDGDLTVQTAALQKTKLLQALRVPYAVIELDLSQVSEIDTTGVQLLLQGCTICMVLGGALRLVCLSPAVREVIELLNLQDRFAAAANHCPECVDIQGRTVCSAV